MIHKWMKCGTLFSDKLISNLSNTFFLMGSGDDYQPTKIPIEAVGRTRANVRMYPNTGNGQ